MNSDHALLIARVKVKLATKKKHQIPTRIKYREPTAQLKAYNESFRQRIARRKLDRSDCKPRTKDIAEAVTLAASQHLTRVPITLITQNKDYLCDRTWHIIVEKEKAIEDGNFHLLPQLNRDINDAHDRTKRLQQ